MKLPHISCTIFVPQGYFSHEGYLSGLTLNKNHTSLLPEYRRVLRFYGYDVGLAPGNGFPPTTSTTTTTTTTTTMSTANEDVSSTMDMTETMTTMEPRGMVTESNDMTGSTAVTYTTALSATETVKELDTTAEQDFIPTAATSQEAGIMLITMDIPRQSTTMPKPSDDDITTAGESTTLSTSDAASGYEQASSLLSTSITSPASPIDDEGASTSAEMTSIAVQGKVPEESAPTVPQETTEQQTHTAEPTEQQTHTAEPTEQQTHTAEPTEQQTELTALMEQPTEMVAGTEKPIEITALTEETTETVTPTEQPTETSPTGTVLQTVQTTGTVAQTEQTGTVVPTEQPVGMETLTEEQTETDTSTEEPTEKMTVLPVTNITDAIPDSATEHVVSTETDTTESTVPDRDVLIQSTNGISEPKTILSTPLPLAHNLLNPTQHENSTLMASKRTTRSIEGKVLFVSVILLCIFCHKVQILFVQSCLQLKIFKHK